MEAKDRIRQRRLELGLTLEQVGSYVGVGKSTVRKWETGYISNMKRDKLTRLAAILQLSPLDLMDDPVEAYETLAQLTEQGAREINLVISDTDPQIDELTAICSRMSADGVQRVIEYALDLSENPKYQKKPLRR